MGTTYMGLVNKVLLRLNEVELNELNFPDALGLHKQAKVSVNDAINMIHIQEFEWPFNAYEHTQTLGVGQEEYGWPTDFKAADWNSFQIKKDATIGNSSKTLRQINTSEWYEKAKDNDENSEGEGRDIPRYVFQAHGDGFGVTPSPNKNYIIRFRYFKMPTTLSLFDDECNIPSRFDHVIVASALYFMYMWLDNSTRAEAVLAKEYEPMLNDMENLLIQNKKDFYDTRVPSAFGGGISAGTSGYISTR